MNHISQVYPKYPSICLCMNVRRASRAVTQFYDEVLKPSGLSVVQLSLLQHIEVAQQASISNLAKLMRIDRTTLNRNMKPLTDAGLIVIRPGEDSRTRQVMITAAGQATMATAWELWGEAQVSLKEYLGQEELIKLIELSSKLEALVP
ncbi:MarR family winged helix-turn-helix transcriptional regulator [Acetonema longum]|uniref:MarR family transcriptional regulator n=1 Tax=Acetonema longum DSM 6540 TaxID=1009370 RepID=F7NG50_9FIRM|nr:MarR family winged helix-turn-helix transcriptional regulator [Acetonema longum]EGO64968.1 MarR family transcriptional regulator [Acetonema longum DSM 6540]